MATALTTRKKPCDTCGVRQFKDGVTFTAFFPEANTVRIAGDFNNWQPEKAPMRKFSKNGIWKVKLPLSVGMHRYRLVVDGQWMRDPCNDASEGNPYGGLNSIVNIS